MLLQEKLLCCRVKHILFLQTAKKPSNRKDFSFFPCDCGQPLFLQLCGSVEKHAIEQKTFFSMKTQNVKKTLRQSTTPLKNFPSFFRNKKVTNCCGSPAFVLKLANKNIISVCFVCFFLWLNENKLIGEKVFRESTKTRK